MADMIGNSEFEAAWEEEGKTTFWRPAIERCKIRRWIPNKSGFDLYVLNKWPGMKVAPECKDDTSLVYLTKAPVGQTPIKKEGLEAPTPNQSKNNKKPNQITHESITKNERPSGDVAPQAWDFKAPSRTPPLCTRRAMFAIY